MKELEHEVVDLAFETEKHHMRFSREGTPLTYPVVQRDSVTGDPPVVGRDVSGGEAEDARDGATRSGDLKGSARHHTVCDDHGRADARRHTRNPKKSEAAFTTAVCAAAPYGGTRVNPTVTGIVGLSKAPHMLQAPYEHQ